MISVNHYYILMAVSGFLSVGVGTSYGQSWTYSFDVDPSSTVGFSVSAFGDTDSDTSVVAGSLSGTRDITKSCV